MYRTGPVVFLIFMALAAPAAAQSVQVGVRIEAAADSHGWSEEAARPFSGVAAPTLLRPHAGNSAWVGDLTGTLLSAESGRIRITCSTPGLCAMDPVPPGAEVAGAWLGGPAVSPPAGEGATRLVRVVFPDL